MSKYLLWILLSSLTGSPLLSAVVLLVGWWVVDRFTLGVLPDPFRIFSRTARAARLRSSLQVNPHDRRAKLELAQLLLPKKRYAEVVALLRPNVEAGDDDTTTLYTLGVACLGAGHVQQGEKLLAHVVESEPAFRAGEVDLELGRFRLERGELAGAKEALERFCRTRRGTVEGRVLLSRVLERSGDDGAAALLREEAWSEFVLSPRFKRRQERFWAWRAKPSRPAMYGAALLLVGALFFGWVAPSLSQRLERSTSYSAGAPYLPDDDE